MPNWFKKEAELPPELKDKTPEQVAELLKKAEADKTRLAELEADRTKDKEQLTTMQTEFNTTKQKLQELEANSRKQTQRQTEEEPADFLVDPEKAVNQRVNAAVSPLAQVTMNTAAQTARLLAEQRLNNLDVSNKTMNGRFFQVWGSEIDDIAKRTPIAQLTQPEGWLVIFDIVKGRHADELMNVEQRNKKYNFLEPTRQNTNTQERTDKSASEVLSDEEKRVADRMGVKHEDYLKRKKAIQFVNA